jgi:uncharacterized protein (TIGR02679 family)
VSSPESSADFHELTTADGSLAAVDTLDRAAAARIRAMVLGAGWGWLTGAVRTAWEADLARTRVRVDLTRLPDAQTAAMADFLRWSTHRSGLVTVDLARLDRLLRSSGLAAGLATVLTATGGPLRDTAGTKRAARAATAAAGAQVWAAAAAHPALRRHPQLARWLDDERIGGRLPAEPAVRGQVLTDALTALAALPDPGTGLARFAQRTLGRAHALDSGPVLGAILRGLAWLTGRSGAPTAAADRRALWAEVGVAVDSVSSTALVLGLRVPGDGPLPVTLRINANAGLPVRLTLVQIQAHLDVAGLPGADVVHVCENPSVVEEAVAALGSACPPLVCVEGQPSVAVVRLLTALRAGGAELRYHGDFDWRGLQIAADILTAGGRPWRFGAADYRAALTAGHGLLPALSAPPAALTCSWDSGLVAAMVAEGRAVEEEHVMELLVADLGFEAKNCHR